MKCKIEGCDRDAMYKEQQVCQMHYFRHMRTGSYDLTRKRKYRVQNPAGYQKVYEPTHFLANSDGYVYEHRFVYYNQNAIVSSCELCGEDISWETLHIDHIDNDVTNNNIANLRALCRSCNVFRGHTSTSMGSIILEINGVKKSSSAWARTEGVKVTGGTIRRRKMMGMSDYDAVYAPKKTHTSNDSDSYKLKYDEDRGL